MIWQGPPLSSILAGWSRRYRGQWSSAGKQADMRAVWVTSAAGPDGLQVRETADPEPGPGQVRVRVRAAGLCFAEVMAAQGLYPDRPPLPCVLGYEAAGVIDAVGEGVAEGRAGARVLAMTRFGGLGGADWRKGYKLLRPGGRLVAFGFANLASGQRRRPVHVVRQIAGIPRLTPLQLMNSNRTVSGVHIGRLWDRMDMLAGELREVLALWEKGALNPRVDGTYPFAEAARAHRRILSRQNVGKIVLLPGA